MPSPFNTLVISDLHLAEDLSPSANAATSRHVDLVERELVAFFEHYSRRRQDGLPWRAVINGDMVDFMAITVLPDRPELQAHILDKHDDDREFGLRRTVDATMYKMELVAERHAALFGAMARFIARGNRIDIIAGNHDIEFQWPEVQRVFVEAVVRAYAALPEAARTNPRSPDYLRARVEFHPWFVYEPGVVWIEHGHQYDENCAFVYNLNPLHPVREEILPNVDTASTRYMANYVREIDAHAQEDWTALGYVKFAVSVGFRPSLKMAKAYFKFAQALLSVRKATLGWRARRARSEGHDRVINRLSERWGLSVKQLRDLDGLRRTPIVSSFHRLMRVLMLDKVFVFGVASILTVLWLLLLGWKTGLVATIGTFFLGSLLLWFYGRGRNVDPAEPLKVVPERILKRVDAEYCVFGHTHKPLRMVVGHDEASRGIYFNTGTWLPSGKPGLLRAFTHVVITHGPGGATAELCQWRDGASRPFTAGDQPVWMEPDAQDSTDTEAARAQLSS